MTRWFKRVAVFAAWLGLGSVGVAQNAYPVPVGATRMTEPLSYTPDAPPPTNLVPGPLNPLIAPAGPPPSLNLPINHTSAFQCDNYPPESACYASLGGMALQRQGLRGLPIVFADQQNNRIDTGNEPIGNLPVLFRLDQVEPSMVGGARATVGYMFASEAVELSGFYIFSNTVSGEVASQGLLFVPFGPGNVIPIGFEGNNNLWRQADLVRTEFTSTVASAEANYRWWNSGINTTHLLLGVRYFYTQERVDIYTDDEFFVRDVFGRPDPVRAANYAAGVRNNYLGTQMGGEYGVPIPIDCCQNSIWAMCEFKTGLGLNFIERTWRLTRGDGFVGFDVHENSIKFASLNEATVAIDFHVMDRVRVRAGYTGILGLGFSTAGSQVDFDFNHQGRKKIDYGTVFYHGPIAELQLLF